MIAHFGIHVLSLFIPAPEPAPPPPPPVVFVGTTDFGTFDGGTTPDMTGAQTAADAVTVWTGDGWVTTGPAELAGGRHQYDDAWDAHLCAARPVFCL